MSEVDWPTVRKRVVSAAYGVGSAVFVPMVGPFAPPILILLFPLVFRRGSNAAAEYLLGGFGLAWLVVTTLAGWWAPPLEGSIAWIAIATGVVPLLAAVFLTRRRVAQRESRRPS